MLDKDFCVLEQKILALHSRAARSRADQNGHVDILEGDFRIRGARHAREERQRAVLELHHDAFQRGLRFVERQFEKLQDDRLVLAQHFACRDSKHQAVADLAGGAGDGDADGSFHEGS